MPILVLDVYEMGALVIFNDIQGPIGNPELPKASDGGFLCGPLAWGHWQQVSSRVHAHQGIA